MGVRAYREVLRVRAARLTLLLGLAIRIPMWAGGVVMTLHVVAHLDRSYAAAGLVTAAATVALAVSGPWRGRMLDRIGLRRTVLPSLVLLTACWSVAPFVGYWLLLSLAATAGLFVVPTFSIIRQVLIAAVDDERRKSALVLDSVAVEISYMIGPVLGVLAATYWSTSWALFACEMASVAGGAALWAFNPPIVAAESESHDGARISPRTWARPIVFAVLAAGAASTIVLTGTDVGVVAALRNMGHQTSIGWVLALWGLGSAVGGLIYGAVHRPISVFALLALLSLATLPVVLATNRLALVGLLFVAGLFCAPTITATVDHLSRVVPATVRGEAMGWHGSALTGGAGLGAPLAGIAIDQSGWRGGFVVTAVAGLAIAVGCLVALGRRHPDRATEPALQRV
ncbi:MAG: MFS transporter [Jatrophihabitans sp.]